MERNLYFYEYVNRPAAEVGRELGQEAQSLLQSATEVAVAQTDELQARLHVQVAGLEVGKDVRIEVGELETFGGRARVPIRWKAVSQTALFPSLEAEILVEPLSDSIPLCQLSIIGRYRPPLSLLGIVGDAMVGHRLAEAAVRNFVRDVGSRLERKSP